MQFLALDAPAAGAAAGATIRSLATRAALGHHELPDALAERAHAAQMRAAAPAGRVESGGNWADAEVHAALAQGLGPPLSAALRERFEWYLCRGAFFHNDAHYGQVLFGVWYAAGPAIDLVLPRARARLPLQPGSCAIFDPFEVHGLLQAEAWQWQADDYRTDDVSAMVGFELELGPEVAARFGIGAYEAGPLISSSTRVAADSGSLA